MSDLLTVFGENVDSASLISFASVGSTPTPGTTLPANASSDYIWSVTATLVAGYYGAGDLSSNLRPAMVRLLEGHLPVFSSHPRPLNVLSWHSKQRGVGASPLTQYDITH